MTDRDGLFEGGQEFPDRRAAQRYEALVGLDSLKARLLVEAELLLDPDALSRWSERHHGGVLPIVGRFRDRTPLFVFAGDVGTGKTALAETFGDALARRLDVAVTLLPMSLSARGSGRVGEMTALISEAFETVGRRARAASGGRRASSATVLLIDEGDALAQSRELAQMHHEDRAGVNALIRGISSLAADRLPVIVVLCTNRLGALDPALQRRAAGIFRFERPDAQQREAILRQALDGAALDRGELADLVDLTGPSEGRPYGYTYSDLTTRLLPAAVLDAYPDRPITLDSIRSLLADNPPTPPFASAE